MNDLDNAKNLYRIWSEKSSEADDAMKMYMSVLRKLAKKVAAERTPFVVGMTVKSKLNGWRYVIQSFNFSIHDIHEDHFSDHPEYYLKAKVLRPSENPKKTGYPMAVRLFENPQENP